MQTSRVFYVAPPESTKLTYVKVDMGRKDRWEKEGELATNQLKHMPQLFMQDVINGLGKQGEGIECVRVGPAPLADAGATPSALLVLSPDNKNHLRRCFLFVRTLRKSLAHINDLAPELTYVTFKTSGTRNKPAIEIANYLATILKDDPDGAVSALGRKEHVNVLYIAKLVRAIRIAMLQYKGAKNEDDRKAPQYDVTHPVVIEGGAGFADEVDKAQMAAQLSRIGTRIWLLTEFDFKVARPPTPEHIKKAAWENQKHDDETAGCFYLEVACTPDIKAACRLLCRGVEMRI